MLLKVIAGKNVWFDTCFFNHGFRFRDSICNGCHDLTMFCLNINDIAIMTVGVD